MKQTDEQVLVDIIEPAAFGRLCVETTDGSNCVKEQAPAAFGRLCVETPT